MANINGHISGCGCGSCGNLDTSKLYNPTACINIEDYIFTCDKLSECTIFNVNTDTQTFDVMGNDDITFESSGSTVQISLDPIKNIINLEIEGYEFTCTDLSGCSISNLGDVCFSDLKCGDQLFYCEGKWMNIPKNPNPFLFTINSTFSLTGGTNLNFTSTGDTVGISLDLQNQSINFETKPFDCDELTACTLHTINDVINVTGGTNINITSSGDTVTITEDATTNSINIEVDLLSGTTLSSGVTSSNDDCVSDEIEILQDGILIAKIKEGKDNSISGTKSVATNIEGAFTDLELRGENDTGTFDVETNDIAQKVFRELKKNGCTMTDTVVVEDYHSHVVYVDSKYGDDTTGVKHRTDKPFKSITAAWAAATKTGVESDTLIVRKGTYDDELSIILNAGERFHVDVETGSDITLFVGGGDQTAVSYLNIQADGSTWRASTANPNIFRVTNTVAYVHLSQAITRGAFFVGLDGSEFYIDFDFSDGYIIADQRTRGIGKQTRGYVRGNKIIDSDAFRFCLKTISNTNDENERAIMYADVQEIIADNVGGSPTTDDASAVSVQGSAKMYLRCHTCYSLNDAAVSILSDRSTTTAGDLEPHIHLITGRYISDDVTDGTVQGTSATARPPQVFIYSSTVFVQNGANAFSIDQTGAGMDLYIYHQTGGNKGVIGSINQVTGTWITDVNII
jgi:hypothetical protein